ncbi:SGNH/GDSL hydrolase family protein [Clostridium swellfunianum]|uniref:SGNH/GDSL hydrolase family protein n=1 Tax=Clostridium swellfunianum TaxID=1367462 RepID=UPI0020304645|nr:SGNH/GDSL hydrolase family protein [Clostridium swellfunianum]MCM0650280.1 SGNH/GDSL hydrolase family protein [Clostridium swellfunianum]
MNKDKLAEGIKIKIIGDSIAAGAGSSMSYRTEDMIFEEDGTKFFRRVAPNSWWGLLEKYLRQNYSAVTVENKGCGGAFSYQIKKHLDDLISREDKLVFLLIGLNDRKRINGMEELKSNCASIVDELISDGKIVVLLTPNPSVHSNEYYSNRIYHTNEVVEILRDVAKSKSIPLVDNYKYIMEYLERNKLVIDDIIYGDGCGNDGLHPSDYVQRLMFQNLIETMQI